MKGIVLIDMEEYYNNYTNYYHTNMMRKEFYDALQKYKDYFDILNSDSELFNKLL
jgi:CO dehydrogenase/acetyl-CoA synthase epsilon subunit